MSLALTSAKMFVDGEEVDSESGKTFKVYNPADGSAIATVPKADKGDVKKAAEAAKKASQSWSSKTVAERSKALLAIADLLRKNNDVLAEMETKNHGSPIRRTKNFDVGLSAEIYEYYASIARGKLGEVNPVGPHVLDFTVREPVGVAGLIVPWNFPLLMSSWKIAPALVSGNTVVVKPASVTPLTTLMFAKIASKVLPKGVLNVITGPGSLVGEEMVANKNIDMISLTGEVETGKRVMELASKSVKRVVTELGGKNPLIVMEDADLESAIEGAIFGSFFNSGQVCATCSRIYVHEKLHDKFVNYFAKAASKLVVSNPQHLETDMGPVVSFEHKEKIDGYVQKGLEEGAKLVVGDTKKKNAPTDGGAYVLPTVFTDVDQDMKIAQEEIFGPVAAVLSFENEDEALNLANDSIYGLSGSLWTKDLTRAHNFASRMHAGTVWINEHLIVYPESPWGGFKQSGLGKELSPHALEEYTRLKHISYDLTGLKKKPWYNLINPHPLTAE
ncbi:MAG: aldehyde dehydrogenase family protein [Nitrososphaerota archaeon]|nr:aldehyde dehydrogenase family protein [Nitrososphaerota archaeon]